MRLTLVRHTEAAEHSHDDFRPLTPAGRKAARALGRFLRQQELVTATELWHSPLVRAQETARLLAEGLGFTGQQVETEGLRPEDNLRTILTRVANHGGDVLVVGHEPHLSALATVLAAGAQPREAFVLKKGGVIRLERSSGFHMPSGIPRWQVQWFLAPEIWEGLELPAASSPAAAEKPVAKRPAAKAPAAKKSRR